LFADSYQSRCAITSHASDSATAVSHSAACDLSTPMSSGFVTPAGGALRFVKCW